MGKKNDSLMNTGQNSSVGNQTTREKEPVLLFEQTVKMSINTPMVITPVNLTKKIIVKNLGIAGDLYVSQYDPVEFTPENRIIVGESKEFEGGAIFMRSASRPNVNIKHVS